tara:strand:+ start:937 stop:1143 length:207 start_codon:yes stop_codon:yes gene_type:complete
MYDEEESRHEILRALVNDCIISHNEGIIVRLLVQLEQEYQDLAKLATMGEYENDWTHQQVLNYVTLET